MICAYNSREKKIYRVTVIGAVVNLFLIIFKFIAGFIGNSGAMIAMIKAMRPYAVFAEPPMAKAPVVSMGMRILASVPPIPAMSVVRLVRRFLIPASLLRAGIMPQYEMSCIV